MKTPNPRGFSATSSLNSVCDNLAAARARFVRGPHGSWRNKRPVPPAEISAGNAPIVPTRYLAALAHDRACPPVVPNPILPTVKLWHEDGKLIFEIDGEKKMGRLAYAYAEIRYGKTRFTFRKSDLSDRILDSRDGQRKELEVIHAECVRLRLDADEICFHLASVATREKKPKPARVPEPASPPLTHATFSSRKLLPRDPVLDYLSRPLTPNPLDGRE